MPASQKANPQLSRHVNSSRTQIQRHNVLDRHHQQIYPLVISPRAIRGAWLHRHSAAQAENNSQARSSPWIPPWPSANNHAARAANDRPHTPTELSPVTVSNSSSYADSDEDIVSTSSSYADSDDETSAYISGEPVDIAVDDIIVLLLAIAVGLSTGFAVVAFNTAVQTIQDHAVWVSVPRFTAFGAQVLQRDPYYTAWRCLVLPPMVGGACVAALRLLVGGFGGDPKCVKVYPSLHPRQKPYKSPFSEFLHRRLPAMPPVVPSPLTRVFERVRDLVQVVQEKGLQATARPYVKFAAAAVTLGSGASLGPEGPSVDVGKANASRITCAAREQRAHVMTDLVAAGAGAGVAAGFGAPMSGVLFAVETVLLSTPKPTAALQPANNEDDTGVLIATVLVACVTAAVVSQAGLGLEPAFTIPATAPLSVRELPLCVIEGLLCGSAAAGLGLATASCEASFLRLRKAGLHPAVLPVIGGLACGSLAVIFPEISYQGFDNFNALFQFDGRQAAEHTAAGLAALVFVKIAATAICRGSGLVGGVYAPALFIGAALGTSFWQIVDGTMLAVASTDPALDAAIRGFELASANTYALVGSAAMLAAFCRVPLTAVLLLFELTKDYTLILPTLMAVGFAQWGAATAIRLMR